jgi:7,8-dihydroneopterin aldolase/epimerase/oxygenase
MRNLIKISGIRGYGFHGVLEEERKNGQEFLVDIEIETKLKNLNDELKKAVDYSKIVDLVAGEISANPVNLIETLAERIAEKIIKIDKKIKSTRVTVHKPAAPVLAKVTDISVSISKSR